VTKGGLVFGGAGGQGILVKRLTPSVNGRNWSAPSAFDVKGGSFGAQIGFESKNIIAILNSESMVRTFSSQEDLKWDATAAGTAGYDSVKESKNELQGHSIRIYSTTKGLFGGATFGGTSISVNGDVNHETYGKHTIESLLDGTAEPPDFARELYAILDETQKSRDNDSFDPNGPKR
jgi:lipid-binding SYLF domain-containing protein